MIFTGAEPERRGDDHTTLRANELKAPVQQRRGIFQMLQHLSDDDGVERVHRQHGPSQITVYQAHACANLFGLIGEQVACKFEGGGVDVHAGNVEAATCQQYLQNAFVASHVQDTLTLCLAGHPVNPAAKNITLSVPLKPFEIDFRSMNSV